MPNVGIPQFLKAVAANGMAAGELNRLDIFPVTQADWAFLFTEHTLIFNCAGQQPALVPMALFPVNLTPHGQPRNTQEGLDLLALPPTKGRDLTL